VTCTVRQSTSLLLALALAGGLPGCGLFQPTEPEPPSGGVVQADYSDPEATLNTLRLAIDDKGTTTGLTAYLDGLASPGRDGLDFNALHLASVKQALQDVVTIPDPWTHVLESAFYPRLIGIDGAAYAMRWEIDTRFQAEDQIGDQDAVLNRVYLIQTASRTIAKGYAKLTFRQTAPGRWVVVTWEERNVEPGDSENDTFSMLRLKP
jgi:hypothetical protein